MYSSYLPDNCFYGFLNLDALQNQISPAEVAIFNNILNDGKIISGPGRGIKYAKNDYNDDNLKPYILKLKSKTDKEDAKDTRIYGRIVATVTGPDGQQKNLVSFELFVHDAHKKLARQPYSFKK